MNLLYELFLIYYTKIDLASKNKLKQKQNTSSVLVYILKNDWL